MLNTIQVREERVRKHWLLSMAALALILLFAACGSSTTSNPGGASGSPNSSGSSSVSSGSSTVVSSNTPVSNPPPTSTSDFGTANGCPSNAVVTGTPTKANIAVTTTQMNQTIQAHAGDIIEVRLPFGNKWSGPITSQGILQLQTPAGYASKDGRVCVWRFVAAGTGSAQLVFHAQALCAANELCPMFITTIPFEFAVK